MRLALVITLAVTLGGAVLAGGCVVQSSPQAEDDLRSRVPGRYVAMVDGQRAELVLEADGTGSVNGQPGQWAVQFGTLMLSDGEQWLPVSLEGDTLTVQTPQGTFVFHREAGAAGGAAAAGVAGGAGGGGPARPFTPERTLPGTAVTAATVSASFTVPDGWQHRATVTDGGDDAHAITPGAGQPQDGGVFVTRRTLGSAEAAASVTQLLHAGVADLLQGAQYETVVAPEELTIGGQRGGRAVVRSTASGQHVELYLAGVVVDGHGFVVAGLYPVGRAEVYRPAVDTVLASFEGRPPARNTAAEQRLAGCWEDYSNHGGSTGSGSFSSTLRLGGDGRYDKRTFISVGAGGGGATSDKREAGRWRVDGEVLTLVPDQGDTRIHRIRLDGGMLFLGNAKHLPCN
jgi:hypothetical protein